MLKIMSVLSLLLILAQSAVAADRVVKCEINSENNQVYKGKCKFMPESGGSFSLSNLTDKPLFGETLVVSVYVVEKGIAEVRGLTKSGINSRWGEAKRSQKDKACWDGEDFRICAR